MRKGERERGGRGREREEGRGRGRKREGEGEREGGKGVAQHVDNGLCVCSMYDPSHATEGDFTKRRSRLW